MSELPGALEAALDGGFAWLTGIEDTFILAPHPTTGRTLDEYELTQHYRFWREDLALAKELGVGAIRYGVPWHRVNPAPGIWDYSWIDGPVERLLELSIEPIIDLVHYGVPAYIEDAFVNPDYPSRVAEYAARIADHFGGRVRWFTPLNEPRITAWYAGKIGFWPPFRHGYKGYLQVLLSVARGIVRTEQALRQAVAGVRLLHVDASDIYDPTVPGLADEAHFRQELGFLALDLVSGRVGADHELLPFLHKHGVTRAELDWFAEQRIELDVVGINLYPMFSQKLVTRRQGRLRLTMPYADGALVERIATLYHRRYGRPILISETASDGGVNRRLTWLKDSVASIARARARGVPIMGYTWWPMFALFAWAYRHGERPPIEYLRQMGLWDLAATPTGELERVSTPLVAAFEALARAGATPVGLLRSGSGAPAAKIA